MYNLNQTYFAFNHDLLTLILVKTVRFQNRESEESIFLPAMSIFCLFKRTIQFKGYCLMKMECLIEGTGAVDGLHLYRLLIICSTLFTDIDFGIALDSDIPRLLSLGEDRVLVCVELVNSPHQFS